MSALYSRRELQEFDLARFFAAASDFGAAIRSLEGEMLAEAARIEGHEMSPTNIVLPWQILSRGLTVAGPELGGVLVGETTHPADILRSASLVGRAGAVVVGGLRGDQRWPAFARPERCAWMSDENDAVASQQPEIGRTIGTPKTCGTLVRFSRSWRKDTKDGPAALEALLLEAVARTIDHAALHGSGTEGAPLGVQHTPGIQVGSIDATGTWDDMTALEANLDAVGAVNRGWIASPAGKRLLRTRSKFANTDSPIWEGAPILDRGMVDAVPAFTSDQVEDGVIFCGDWSRLIIAGWGIGPRIALKDHGAELWRAGLTEARVLADVDVIVTRPEALGAASLT